MADGGAPGRDRCCRCGSESHLARCAQCARPVCPKCRASPGGADEYMCVKECTLASFTSGWPKAAKQDAWVWFPSLLRWLVFVFVVCFAVWTIMR